MSKFKKGDEVIVFADSGDAFSDELGQRFIIEASFDWGGEIWYDCGEFNISEIILRRPTKLDKALK